MDKNKVGTVNDVIDEINGEVEKLKTMVTHDRDNSTIWMDVDDDPDARRALEGARLLTILGVLVIDNWDEIKQHFPEDVQDQVDEAMYLFLDMSEQPEDDEE